MPSRSFGGLDRRVGLHRDRERRAIVHDVDRDRRFFGLLRREIDQRVDVAEADVIGAARDFRDRRRRAIALVDVHLKSLGFEVALVLGEEEPALRALIFPVQHEFQLGLRLRGRRERRRECERAGKRQQGTSVG